MYANFHNPSVAWDRREDKIFENCLGEIPDCVNFHNHSVAWDRREDNIFENCLGEIPECVNFHNHSVAWDRREDKIFENCLVEIPDCVENRWQLIARRIPGKSPEDVRVHYEDLLFDLWQIDSGMVDPPSYPDQTVSLGWDDRSRLRDSGQISFASSPARSRHLEVDRKKGTPWTEHEHRLFLLGLKKYGKGDWRSISRNLIVTKTPTQVASHAQKYFLRQSNDNKEKKRSSIHDITTTIDSLTVPAQPNFPVPDQAKFQYFPSPHDVS